jgi:hypothetical protein
MIHDIKTDPIEKVSKTNSACQRMALAYPGFSNVMVGSLLQGKDLQLKFSERYRVALRWYG